MKERVLFLCTGNSCRSQMAEGLLRNLDPDRFEAFSAGTRPSSVNPKAITVMAELGIDISGHTSDAVEKYVGETLDTVVTVCDNAKESCPVFPGKVKMINWSFFDPAEAEGNPEEVLDVFRKVRDEIKTKIEGQFG